MKTSCTACHTTYTKSASPLTRITPTLATRMTGADLCEGCREEVASPMKDLFTTNNPKTAKGEASGYLTHVLHLAPHRVSGYNVCPMATAGCSAACLNTAGRGGIMKPGCSTNSIQRRRIIRTRQYMTRRGEFMARIVREIENGIKRASRYDLTPVFRLNGTSDIRWELEPVRRDGVDYGNVMLAFPDITFYDYTKLANRWGLPANYTLTFSLADGNMGDVRTAMRSGMNIAVVFAPRLPRVFMGWPVIDGDVSDLRFTDPGAWCGGGVVVGLKAKGKAKHDITGFVYRVDTDVEGL